MDIIVCYSVSHREGRVKGRVGRHLGHAGEREWWLGLSGIVKWREKVDGIGRDLVVSLAKEKNDRWRSTLVLTVSIRK